MTRAGLVVVALGAALSGCPPPGGACDIDSLVITVGADQCAQPCTVDFGDVVVPLAETRRIAFGFDNTNCQTFGFVEVVNDSSFTINSQSTSPAGEIFAQVQYAPLNAGPDETTLMFFDDFTGESVDVALVGRGVDP